MPYKGEYEYGDETGMPEEIAREVASAWHGGQWSALYALASTGTVKRSAVQEIDECIASLVGDRAINAHSLSCELRALRAYVVERMPEDSTSAL